MIYILIFIFGLCVGSFLNVAIYRLEKEESIVIKRSYCPQCKKQLKWYDLIPVFSFVLLRGKCRQCKKKISWQYPLVELATGLLFLLIFFSVFSVIPSFSVIPATSLVISASSFVIPVKAGIQMSLMTAYYLFIISILIIIFVYDLKHYIILDKIIFSAIIIALIYRLITFSTLLNLAYLLLAALVGGGFFLFLVLISKGKWMGLGDVKLAILMGLVLGWPHILLALFLSFMFGAIVGVSLILLKRKKIKSEIPFGPFLTFATLLVILYGDKILSWYLGFLL